MSSTFLERIRHNHELDERHELAIVAALDNKPVGQKAKTWQQHIISHHLDEIVNANKELQELYEDKDNILRDELESMRGPNMFSSFYDNLKRLNEHHQRYPNIPVETFERVEEPIIEVPFSGEEVFGKYLDLNEFFVRYANLPNVPGHDQDYIQYLNKFNSFFHISESTKLTKAYISYINDLWAYLSDFFARIQPLVDMDELMAPCVSEFEELWKAGKVEGWSHRPVAAEPQALRLGMFNDVSELEALGLDRLKEGLDALGLKSGGTLKERAARLWQVRGKKPEDIPDKLKKKKDANGRGEEDKRKSVAFTEHRIAYLTSMLSDVVTATRRHAEKQQTLTLQEKHAEIREEEMGTLPDLDDEEEEDLIDEDGPLYNPLNLPLGWDGKPIPFWLYKLHGLGTEFKCEICGNHSYWGRRMFDKHFQEWRHAYGMKCLGVPNTKHFHDITLIEDALALYAKIKDQLRVEQFVGDMEEEFEDSEGNVLNRRTYEDLARQGLL